MNPTSKAVQDKYYIAIGITSLRRLTKRQNIRPHARLESVCDFETRAPHRNSGLTPPSLVELRGQFVETAN